jgi:hypothetical protein
MVDYPPKGYVTGDPSWLWDEWEARQRLYAYLESLARPVVEPQKKPRYRFPCLNPSKARRSLVPVTMPVPVKVIAYARSVC